MQNKYNIRLLLFMLFLLFIGACKKDGDQEFSVKEDDLQEDTLISVVEMETYVNQVYIDLMGRKPSESEFSTAMTNLAQDRASVNSREQFVEGIIATEEYYDKLYNYNKSEYLNGVEESEITAKRQELAYVYLLAVNDGNNILEELTLRQLEQIDSLEVVPQRLRAEVFSEQEMHKRMCLNPFYDDINMGVPNFTFAVFEGFLFRAPTGDEWQNAQNICNNLGGAIFGITGNSKPDFLDIVFNSDHYFEGRVISAYLRFLGRRPNTVELYDETKGLRLTKDYNNLYKKLVTTNEYFGRE